MVPDRAAKAVTGVDVGALLAAFEVKRARIGVIGLGYVGMPLALTAARAGYRVLGFDINAPRVQQINRGETFIRHIAAHHVAEAVRSGFEATADFGRLGEPDLSFVENTAKAIAPHLRRGQLVVLESTTYPGTTDEVLRPILEASGLKSGEDFFLAFSPEREDPGNPDFGTSTIPKVVGGDGADALALAEALYGQLVVRTVPVSSTA